jgi:hypothetical protein
MNMNSKLMPAWIKQACHPLLFAILCHSSTLFAQGTAFTYQGWLQNNGSPANGSYDLRFIVYNAGTGGSQIGPILTNAATAVNDGLFTVALDFGTGIFDGNNYWLDISVRTNGTGVFGELSPRQQLRPTPYAITAENLAGVVENNTVAPGEFATIGGGQDNVATEYADTVGGGADNTASSLDGSATVSGGYLNTASGDSSTVGGGYLNTASGDYSTVPGGSQNTAGGNFSFAAGLFAQALHQGSFVWADSQNALFSSTADDQFSVRAQGGVVLAADVTLSGGAAYHNLSLSGGNSLGYLYGSYPALADGVHLGYNWYYDATGTGHAINSGGATSRLSVGYGFVGLYVGGVDGAPTTERLYANGSGVTVYGTFNNSSDRNAKQDFAPVSPSDILDKVLRLPVSEWSYKTDAATRHIGPMGQDFYSTFNLGTDEKHIAPIDEGGVALAAIQGLNQKLQEQDAAVQQLKQQNGSLLNRLNELEQLIQSSAQKK